MNRQYLSSLVAAISLGLLSACASFAVKPHNSVTSPVPSISTPVLLAASDPTSFGMSQPQPSGVPYPTYEAALRATLVAKIRSTLTAEAPTPFTLPTLGSMERTAWTQEHVGNITLQSNQQTVTYMITTRFFIFLDEKKYPVSSLDCKPSWHIGRVTNWVGGPNSYPAYYEASIPGSCTLTSGDFAVNIVVVDPTRTEALTPSPYSTLMAYPSP